MIFPVVALVALLARASAQLPSIDFKCVEDFNKPPLDSCLGLVQGECAEGETLFDVLDPDVLCKTKPAGSTQTCAAGLSAQAKTYDSKGCCTSNSLYPAMDLMASINGGGSNCSTSEELSYEGFAATIDYFCASEEVEGEDFYCLTDGQELLMEVAYHNGVANTLPENQRLPYLMNNIDCDKIQATECCYPSIKEFIDSCGDDAAKALLPALDNFLTLIPQLCAANSVTLDFSAKCPGLSDINNCFAATDDNCLGGDDDDAAFSVVPTFAAAFAAVFGFLFFARQH